MFGLTWNITNVPTAINVLLWGAAWSDMRRCTLELSCSNVIYVPSLLYFRPPWSNTSVSTLQKRLLHAQTVKRPSLANVLSVDTGAERSKSSTAAPCVTSSLKSNRTCWITKHFTPERSPTAVRYAASFTAARNIWRITRRATLKKPTTTRANSARGGSVLANTCRRICSCTQERNDSCVTYATRGSPLLEILTDTELVTLEWRCTVVLYV